LTVCVEELGSLVQSTQSCNTVSLQRIHDVSLNWLAFTNLKLVIAVIIFCLNNLNVVIILSCAIFFRASKPYVVLQL